MRQRSATAHLLTDEGNANWFSGSCCEKMTSSRRCWQKKRSPSGQSLPLPLEFIRRHHFFLTVYKTHHFTGIVCKRRCFFLFCFSPPPHRVLVSVLCSSYRVPVVPWGEARLTASSVFFWRPSPPRPTSPSLFLKDEQKSKQRQTRRRKSESLKQLAPWSPA